MLTGAAAAVTIPRAATATAAEFYETALVIDGLCFGRERDEATLDALRAARYSGIVGSLPREDLQTAIDALVEWRACAGA